LSQDLDGKLDDPTALDWFGACFMSGLDSMFLVAGLRLIRTGMVAQLATVKQERNSAILRVIENEGALRRLSEQLQKSRLSWNRLEYPESKTRPP
jgi:hypothetical protein